jgi:hypothetical protein
VPPRAEQNIVTWYGMTWYRATHPNCRLPFVTTVCGSSIDPLSSTVSTSHLTSLRTPLNKTDTARTAVLA